MVRAGKVEGWKELVRWGRDGMIKSWQGGGGMVRAAKVGEGW